MCCKSFLLASLVGLKPPVSEKSLLIHISPIKITHPGLARVARLPWTLRVSRGTGLPGCFAEAGNPYRDVSLGTGEFPKGSMRHT